MSIYAYIAAALLAITFYTGSVWKAYSAGKTTVQAEWTAANLKAEQDASKEQFRRQEIVNGYATTRVTKAAKDRETVASNAGKVDQYAPTDFPPLPGTFRLWHNAAAEGKALDDRPRTDAPGVSLAQVSRTVAFNYATCRYDQERLTELQAIVKVLNGE